MKKLLIFGLLLYFVDCMASLNPLPANQAFQVAAKIADEQSIIIQWRIAPTLYLYRNSISFHLENSNPATIGQPILPQGIKKHDAQLGDYEVYAKDIAISIPLLSEGRNSITLIVNYQGCSSDGFCYPPMKQQFLLNTSETKRFVTGTFIDASTPKNLSNSLQNQALHLLREHHFGLILLGFFGFGLLLSFTPCVLPMIPILSGIILGQNHIINTRKAFFLSLSYVLSMAITYAVAGMLIGYIGGSIQVFLQKPWVIVLFSFFFVVLSLSLFDLYQLRLPAKVEGYILNLSGQQKGGSYIRVAIMGCLATLIISPCVSPALVGTLSYISQTGDALLGGLALFAMGLGMGVPLLVVGTAGSKFLPKAGPWMIIIKQFFGLLLLAVAISLLDRILAENIILILWASLILFSAFHFMKISVSQYKIRIFCKCLGLFLLMCGGILLLNAALNNTNLLQPLAFQSNRSEKIDFQTVYNSTELQKILEKAKFNKKPVLLDFYAKWCIACRELDDTIFADKTIKQLLKNFILVRADITANDPAAKELMNQFNVIAPPAIQFFNSKGQWLKNYTIVGTFNAKDLIHNLILIQN